MVDGGFFWRFPQVDGITRYAIILNKQRENNYMKKLIIILTVLFTVSAQAGSLGDETKKYLSQGYEISASGIMNTERGFAGTYFVMLTNMNAEENPFIVCEKRYDRKDTNCYSL